MWAHWGPGTHQGWHNEPKQDTEEWASCADSQVQALNLLWASRGSCGRSASWLQRQQKG
jgi:hypothetical protein